MSFAYTSLLNAFKQFSCVQIQQKALLCTQARLLSSAGRPTDASLSSSDDTSTNDVFQEDGKPTVLSRKLEYPVPQSQSKLAWLESLKTIDSNKLGMLDLHPDVFATYPRIDILHKNVHWQQFYRHIDYGFMRSRAELSGGGRKPWQQKGTGRARHGSNRSPLWIRGSKAHGPRGPKSYFYMLPTHQRALGLRVALSCKYAQNDLVIVDDFNIPSSDPQYMTDLADVRFWGYSILFVDDSDIMPPNIAKSLNQIPGFTLMPAYGLNVYSMLKHETLVLTLSALERIERKLLNQLYTTERSTKFINTRKPEDFHKRPMEDTSMYRKYSAPFIED